MEQITLNGWQISIKRKPYRRTISIVLKPFENPTVHANMKTPLPTILKFLKSRETWIEKNLQQLENIKPVPQYSFVDGEKLLLRGQEFPLKVQITLLKKPFIQIASDSAQLFVPQKLWAKKHQEQKYFLEALKSFYRQQAEKFMNERVQYWSQQMGLRPKEVSFRAQRSRWGSCSTQGCISLNWKLILAPDWIIDSVIVHELAHLKYMNHSKDFWSLVESTMPEYHNSDRWLFENQYLLKFLN